MITEDLHIATEIKQLVSADQAHHYQIVPISLENNVLLLYTATTEYDELENELEIVLGYSVRFKNLPSDTLTQYLTVNYRQKQQKQSELNYSDDFLLGIIHEAKEIGSSDIHFEIFETQGRVRFRIDGKLIERYLVQLSEYPILVNRIKIMSQLDISEKRLPQDGRINIQNGTEEFDIRVSVLPTLHGEKVVLRILSKDSTNIQLDQLGFSEIELKLFKSQIKKPNGIILISGPTGSGKTTTLYATLKLLNDASTNILTIEDPIEYTLEGINQVQLKEQIGLDFSSTLRTFLRQDPDIIMVGEIRDTATATMAIRAALTGHLVLSTIHTNSAWATVSRLIDMDVPPFLIASTLHMSVAQRLVRKLCKYCKTSAAIETAFFPENFTVPDNLKEHYEPKGCNACHHTGYTGRKAIYEIIPITQELVEKIKNNQMQIDDYLTEKKINTLQDNAIQLVKEGTTSVEEVYALLT